jgi:hypothetical protein
LPVVCAPKRAANSLGDRGIGAERRSSMPPSWRLTARTGTSIRSAPRLIADLSSQLTNASSTTRSICLPRRTRSPSDGDANTK